MPNVRLTCLIALLAVAMPMVGCSWQPVHAPLAARSATGPLYDIDGYARSLSLGSLDMQADRVAATGQALTESELTWRDRRAVVDAGVQSPTIETTRTVVYDRQHLHHGKVHDHYHRSTIITSERQTVR